MIELGENNKKNYLLTVDNENGPIKFFDAEDFNETDVYLNSEKVKVNSSDIKIEKIITSSGLIIKNDSSIPFIYFSFILIMLGTLLSVVPTKQVWILASEKSKKIYMGGLSNRNLAGFRGEFLNLSDNLKNY